jgi:UDP-2,3-diacylglucosamine hydrolase
VSKATLFISDLHLHPARPATLRAFAQFLQNHTHCERLFILGDLFDVWIGDDDDSDIALHVAQLLRNFSDAGPELFIMQGNRDFLLGDEFCRSVGGELVPDPIVIDLQGVPTLLMHGDSLCTDDAEYQAFRKMVRDPQWRAETLSHSLVKRRDLAKELRSKSKASNSLKAMDIMDVSESAVMDVMQSHSVKQLIHGHTHRPARHQENTETRWVLGDWDEVGWVLEATKDNLNLNKFIINQ